MKNVFGINFAIISGWSVGPGEGFGVGFRWVVAGGFPVENQGKGGWGVGWG